MSTFFPAIAHDTDLIEFPRPILICRIHDVWDFLKLKTPLQDGEIVSGLSRNGAVVTIEGQIGSHSGALRLTEAEMLDTVETLRAALHPSDPDGYRLGLYRAEDEVTHRFFQKCRTTRFDVDLSSKHLYSYAVSIHAADPTLQTGVLP